MARSRIGHCNSQVNRSCSGSKPSQCREVNALAEVKAYDCTTKHEEMSRHLAAQGIQLPNFAYDFSIVEEPRRLSDTADGSFLLPLHELEIGFHLPLHPFFYHLLRIME